ncbi:MAG TPA: SRPBCC domain-containing protein, partial [Acidimicrobiales bacterium]
PDVPLRFELTVELPGTPQQVWEAIATSAGNAAWFMPTDVEEREGGAICFHMGDEAESRGTVTGWDPPRRFAIEEPDWASLTGHEGAPVTPLATEYLIEAGSGGTCVVRVVSSAFGTGADWEQEFLDEMEKGWAPFFENLRLYLTHFAGRRVTRMDLAVDVPGKPPAVWADLRRGLGLDGPDVVGTTVAVRDVTAVVHRVDDGYALLRATDPVAGMLGAYVYARDDDVATANLAAYLFSDGADGWVAQERPAWERWLRDLALPGG